MEYIGVNLKIVYELIKPFLQDLIKEKAKNILNIKTSRNFRSHVYFLYKTIGEFEETVQMFVNELSELVETYDKRGYKHYEFLTQSGEVESCGRDIILKLARLETALELTDPELEIYAEDVHFMARYASELEQRIEESFQRELQRVISPNNIDFSNLKSVLKDARINLEFIRETVEEIRKFIKINIPLKAE